MSIKLSLPVLCMVAESELSEGNQEMSEIKPRGMVRLKRLRTVAVLRENTCLEGVLHPCEQDQMYQ